MTTRSSTPNDDLDLSPKSAEGLATGEGATPSDAKFHSEAWESDFQADLERISNSEADLALQRAESAAEISSVSGAQAFKGLITLYPDDPRVSEWKKRAEQLSGALN